MDSNVHSTGYIPRVCYPGFMQPDQEVSLMSDSFICVASPIRWQSSSQQASPQDIRRAVQMLLPRNRQTSLLWYLWSMNDSSAL